MAFQVNLPNEEAWAKEIASSQSGVVQGIQCASACPFVDVVCCTPPRTPNIHLPFDAQSLRSTRTGVDLARQ